MKKEIEELLDTDMRLKNLYTDSDIIKQTLDMGGDLIDCLSRMEENRKDMINEILTLSTVQPRKLKGPDGKTYVWRCPTEMIPEQE